MDSSSPESPAAVPEDDLALARWARDQISTVPGVARLGRGSLSEVATYWVDTKVVGVLVQPETLEVHVVARYPEGFPLADLSRRIRQRLAPLAGDRAIDIVVDDVSFRDEAGDAVSQAESLTSHGDGAARLDGGEPGTP